MMALSEQNLLNLGREIWEQRTHRWFYDYEIFLMLSLPHTLGIPIKASLDVVPKDGDAFLFYVNDDIKDEHYDWKRKKPKVSKTETKDKKETKRPNQSKRQQRGKPKTSLQESHDHILINQEKKIQSIYIKTESNEFFKRRIYKLDQRQTYYYQLSHYRNDEADTEAANKTKPIDPRVGLLVYTYILEPNSPMFHKDLLNSSSTSTLHYLTPIAEQTVVMHPPNELSAAPSLSIKQEMMADDDHENDNQIDEVEEEEEDSCIPPTLGKRNYGSLDFSNSNRENQLHSAFSLSLSARSQLRSKKLAIAQHDNPYYREEMMYNYLTGDPYPISFPPKASPVVGGNPFSTWNSNVYDAFNDMQALSTEDILESGLMTMSLSNESVKLYTDEQLQNLSYSEIKAAHKVLDEFVFTQYIQQEISLHAFQPERFRELDEAGYNLFHYCCQQAYFLPYLKQLVPLYPDLLTVPADTDSEDTALFLAVAAGLSETAFYLIDQLEVFRLQHECTRVNQQGENILEVAINHRRYELFEALHQYFPNLPCPSSIPSPDSKPPEPQGWGLIYNHLQTPVEKIVFAKSHPHILQPDELQRFQMIAEALTPQELKQLEEECRLIASKKQYMIKKKYCHLRELYKLLFRAEKERKEEEEVVSRSKIISIHNIPIVFSEDSLLPLFDRFGTIVQKEFPLSPLSNITEGHGEVEFENEEIAKQARDEMNGFMYNGSALIVSLGSTHSLLSSRPSPQKTVDASKPESLNRQHSFEGDGAFPYGNTLKVSTVFNSEIEETPAVDLKRELHDNVMMNLTIEQMKSENDPYSHVE